MLNFETVVEKSIGRLHGLCVDFDKNKKCKSPGEILVTLFVPCNSCGVSQRERIPSTKWWKWQLLPTQSENIFPFYLRGVSQETRPKVSNSSWFRGQYWITISKWAGPVKLLLLLLYCFYFGCSLETFCTVYGLSSFCGRTTKRLVPVLGPTCWVLILTVCLHCRKCYYNI